MEVLAEMLSGEKRQRFYSLRNLADRQRLLAGDIIVRSVVAQKLHCTPEEINFNCNSYGKPYLPDSNGIFFNLSHSGNYTVAVFSDKEVGIDIEEIKPLMERLEIARVFMSDREHSVFSTLPEEEKQSWFYHLWAAKESFIKNTGKGVFEGLQSITVDFSGKRIHVYKNNRLLPGLYIHEVRIDPQFAVYICGYHAQVTCTLKII